MNDFENKKCDICGNSATKDSKISGIDTWGYVCDDCFSKYCSGVKGTYTTLKNIGKPNREIYSD